MCELYLYLFVVFLSNLQNKNIFYSSKVLKLAVLLCQLPMLFVRLHCLCRILSHAVDVHCRTAFAIFHFHFVSVEPDKNKQRLTGLLHAMSAALAIFILFCCSLCVLRRFRQWTRNDWLAKTNQIYSKSAIQAAAAAAATVVVVVCCCCVQTCANGTATQARAQLVCHNSNALRCDLVCIMCAIISLCLSIRVVILIFGVFVPGRVYMFVSTKARHDGACSDDGKHQMCVLLCVFLCERCAHKGTVSVWNRRFLSKEIERVDEQFYSLFLSFYLCLHSPCGPTERMMVTKSEWEKDLGRMLSTRFANMSDPHTYTETSTEHTHQTNSHCKWLLEISVSLLHEFFLNCVHFFYDWRNF